MSIDNAACPDTDIARHGAKVHARAPLNPATNVSYIICGGVCCKRIVGPQVIGRGIGNQIDPRASLLANGVCDIS
jgi:hypothetical protein